MMKKQVLSFINVLLQSLIIGHSLSHLPSHQILVVHINKTLADDDSIYHNIKATNPNINTLCTIHRNETNTKSFTSLYMTGYTDTIHLHDITSFYHIIHINDLPYPCIEKLNITQTKQMRNTNYRQTQIDVIPNNNNKVLTFADGVDPQNICQCPNKIWNYFMCSFDELWLIYLCVLLCGVIIGAFIIILIIYCCWKSKKKKFVKRIISDYKKKKKKVNGVCDHHIHIKDKRNRKKDKKQRSKYALVAVEDHKENKKKRKRDKKRRKTLPTNPNQSDKAGDILKEENHLLQMPSRLKSFSDPFNPHKKVRNSRSNRHKNSSKHRSHKSRSRSPWKEKKGAKRSHIEEDEYEQYRFHGNNNQLLQARMDYDYVDNRRHSSKSKKYNKNKKRIKEDNDIVTVNDSYNIDVKHYIAHGGLPKLAAAPSPGESKTKKSIGIDLAQMKAKNYEENRKENKVGVSSLEMHNMVQNNGNKDMVIHEGVEADINNRKQEDSNHMGSLTNINDEGIAGIENILSEMKQMNERNLNENEESSSFTVKSGDVVSSNEQSLNQVCDDVMVNKSGSLLIPTNTKRMFKLPKPKTKGVWM